MFVYKKMYLVWFDWPKPTVGLGFDIEDTNIFFNLINKDT